MAAAGEGGSGASSSSSRDGDYRALVGETIRSTTAEYEVLDFLGKGTFGQVLKCWRRDSGELVALKVLKALPSYAKQGQLEVEILARLRTEDASAHNFVKAYESFSHGSHICIVFELLHMNLYDYLKTTGFRPMPLRHIRPILQQVMVCLLKLRELGVVHADLKPENIMFVDPERLPFRVKVVDFGSATCPSPTHQTSYMQSRYYRAPEVILGLGFDQAVDMWSLGCVAAELFLGWPLFPGTSEYDQLRYIVTTLGVPTDYQLTCGTKTKRFMSCRQSPTGLRWDLKSASEYRQEYGTVSKETRKYKFASLTDIALVPLDPLLDTLEAAVEKVDRQEFVSLLSGLLRLGPATRLTPEQALHKPFVTLHHLAVHTNVPIVQESIALMQICQHSKCVHVPESIPPCFIPVMQSFHGMMQSSQGVLHPSPPEPPPLVYSLAPSTVAYFPPPPIAQQTDDRGYASAESSPLVQDRQLFFPGCSHQIYPFPGPAPLVPRMGCSHMQPCMLRPCHCAISQTPCHCTPGQTTFYLPPPPPANVPVQWVWSQFMGHAHSSRL